MINYLKGKLTELLPAQATVECHGVGYALSISLNTYSAIQGKEDVMLYVYESIREDAKDRQGSWCQDCTAHHSRAQGQSSFHWSGNCNSLIRSIHSCRHHAQRSVQRGCRCPEDARVPPCACSQSGQGHSQGCACHTCGESHQESIADAISILYIMCKAYKNQPRILNKQHSKLILIYDKPLSRCSKIFYYIKIFLNTYLSEKHFRHKHH